MSACPRSSAEPAPASSSSAFSFERFRPTKSVIFGDLSPKKYYISGVLFDYFNHFDLEALRELQITGTKVVKNKVEAVEFITLRTLILGRTFYFKILNISC